jgi:hypothetical protein
MSTRRNSAVSPPAGEISRSSEDHETAAILAQADRDCDAGLGLRGRDVKAFLDRVLDDARTRVAAATIKHG